MFRRATAVRTTPGTFRYRERSQPLWSAPARGQLASVLPL